MSCAVQIMRQRPPSPAFIAVALLGLLFGLAASGRAAAASGFVGVNAGGPLFAPRVEVSRQFDGMVAAGVQSVRVVFNWAQAQPYGKPAYVPAAERRRYRVVDGVPTDFSATDRLVGLAAARGLTLLPTVLYAPDWDLGYNWPGYGPPANPASYGNYLKALIGRYGPHGTFWRTHRPARPVRRWQIWNEPNLAAYWPQPFAAGYVDLLRAARAAVKAADPGAEVVLGAIANVAWSALKELYRIPGAAGLFDVVAVNGFTSTPDRVITFLRLVRATMNRAGDARKPLMLTELSWPSAAGERVRHNDWDTTERGQAARIAAMLPRLAAARRSLGLASFFYYTWLSRASDPGGGDFKFAGLLKLDSGGRIIAKPALAAFRTAALRIEGCRRKGATAAVCLHR